jgi:hypothetical protein
MLCWMSIRDQAKEWARQQADQLRNDPKAWARAQGRRFKELVDVAPFSDDALQRELGSLRERMARVERLDPDERQQLSDDLVALHERLTAGGAMVSGAKAGLAASVLPVVGFITGPLIGSAYGIYRSQQLGQVRDEIRAMLRQLARR